MTEIAGVIFEDLMQIIDMTVNRLGIEVVINHVSFLEMGQCIVIGM